MSYISISKNNEALSKINQAISIYKSAIDTIKASNNNAKASEIIKLINEDINNLENAQLKIDSINSQISTAMKKLEKDKEEKDGSDK